MIGTVICYGVAVLLYRGTGCVAFSLSAFPLPLPLPLPPPLALPHPPLPHLIPPPLSPYARDNPFYYSPHYRSLSAQAE